MLPNCSDQILSLIVDEIKYHEIDPASDHEEKDGNEGIERLLEKKENTGQS